MMRVLVIVFFVWWQAETVAGECDVADDGDSASIPADVSIWMLQLSLSSQSSENHSGTTAANYTVSNAKELRAIRLTETATVGMSHTFEAKLHEVDFLSKYFRSIRFLNHEDNVVDYSAYSDEELRAIRLNETIAQGLSNTFEAKLHEAGRLGLRASWLFVLACLYATYTGRKGSKVAKLDTAALGGLRAILGVWVLCEHAGLTYERAGGSNFLVLSGCVLSTSRTSEPGGVKAPFTFQEYVKFVYTRLARVLPLYWFSQAVSPMFDKELSDNPFKHMFCCLRDFLLLPVEQTNKFFLIEIDYEYWFVRCIVVLYCLFPVLERLALGPEAARPASRSRLWVIVGLSCAAKYLSYLSLTWTQWAGFYSYKANPFIRIPDFLLGMVIPHLAYHTGKVDSTEEPEQAVSGVEKLIPYFTDVLFLYFHIQMWFLRCNSWITSFWDLGYYMPFSALFLWGMCFGPSPSPLGKLLSSHFFVWVGEAGYGMYIFNVSMLGWFGLGHFVTPPCQYGGCTGPELLYIYPAQGTWIWAALGLCIAFWIALSRTTFILVEEPFSGGARRLYAALAK